MTRVVKAIFKMYIYMQGWRVLVGSRDRERQDAVMNEVRRLLA
jgi:hypothetical protein